MRMWVVISKDASAKEYTYFSLLFKTREEARLEAQAVRKWCKETTKVVPVEVPGLEK